MARGFYLSDAGLFYALLEKGNLIAAGKIPGTGTPDGLREALKSAKKFGKEGVWTYTFSTITGRWLPQTEVLSEEETFELLELYTLADLPEAEYVLDQAPVGNGRFVVAVVREEAVNLDALLRRAGIKVEALESATLSLLRLLSRYHPTASKGNAFVGHADPRLLEYLLLVEGVPRVLGSFPLDSKDLPGALVQVISALDKLYGVQEDLSVFLSGEAVLQPDVRVTLEEELSLQAIPLLSPQGLKLPADVEEAELPYLGPALGAALRGEKEAEWLMWT